MTFFDSTLIHPIFDVESIGDGPRVPRAHLEVVFTSSPNEFRASPVQQQQQVGELRLRARGAGGHVVHVSTRSIYVHQLRRVRLR